MLSLVVWARGRLYSPSMESSEMAHGAGWLGEGKKSWLMPVWCTVL